MGEAEQRRDWIAEMAEREKQRRETLKICHSPALAFQAKLDQTVRADIRRFNDFFRGERTRFEQLSQGDWSVIRRVEGEGPTEEGILPAVRFTINVERMILRCRFPHAARLDREFRLALQDDGTVGLVAGSIEAVSEYLLAPVLFGELTEGI